MLRDLAALTPPLVVCVAFLIGMGMFLRRQMSARRRPGEGTQADITDDTGNATAGSAPGSSPPHGISR
jgi:hypothetical protein